VVVEQQPRASYSSPGRRQGCALEGHLVGW
jgi:hypothetical protein